MALLIIHQNGRRYHAFREGTYPVVCVPWPPVDNSYLSIIETAQR